VPPAGQHLGDRSGDPTRPEVSATPVSLLEGAGRGTAHVFRQDPDPDRLVSM